MIKRKVPFRGSLLLFLALLAHAPAFGGAPHRNTWSLSLSSATAETDSYRCGTCHNAEFAFWVGHPHSHFLVDPARDPRLIRAVWAVQAPGWARLVAGRFNRGDVAFAVGLQQVQVFLRNEGHEHRLLPAQWNLREKRWEPLQAEFGRIRRVSGSWEEACAGCHFTRFDPWDNTFGETNVGCEACHGDGAAHAESGGLEPIVHPAKLPAERRSEICGACHSRGRSRLGGRPYASGFEPGNRLADVYALETPVPGVETQHFWPDGIERLPWMEYSGFIQSGHHKVGMSCTTCHSAHGSDHDHVLRRDTADICQGCHGEAADASPVHRAHPQGEADCVSCHMPLLNPQPDQPHVHTHTFRFLEPGRALESGEPSSCTVECHQERSLRWAVDVLEVWRGQ